MKIAMMIQGLEAGGAQKQFYYLARGLSKSHDVSVISLVEKGEYWEKLEKHSGVDLYFMNRRHRYDFTFVHPLRNVLNDIQPEVLQTFMPAANSIGGFLKLVTDLPNWVTGIRASDMRYDNLGSYLFLLGDLLVTSFQADRIICNSYRGKEVHQKLGFPEEKMDVIPNGIDLDQIERLASKDAPESIAEDTFNIGIFATVTPMKDHDTFLSAMKKLTREKTDVHVYICGKNKKNYWNEVKERHREFLRQDVVTYLGHQSNPYPIMKKMDTVVSSSAFGEGMSNTIMETMLLEVPVVATDVGDAGRLIASEQEGIVVPPGNASAIKQAIVRFMDEPANARSMAARARQKIEDFTIEKMVNHYLSVYEHLLEHTDYE